jgi:site-specific DNA-methyltransferase (adenine-specific)
MNDNPTPPVRHTLPAAEEQVRAIVTQSPNGAAWYTVDSTHLALKFREDTPFEVWQAETRTLLEVARGIQWLVGDALAFGEDHWGEDAAQVFNLEEYTFDAVEKMIRTSKAIPPHRRRPAVGYSVHQEVVGLPVAQQEEILAHASTTQATKDEVRSLVRTTRRRLIRESAARQPVPDLALPQCTLQVADARQLPLDDSCVDLIITSPPYGLDVAYTHGDITAIDWVLFMLAWLPEALRVTKPHGRLALNTPLDTTKGGLRPTYADAVYAATEAGWTYQSTIVWHDNSTTKGNRALGSVDSASRPFHVSQVEMIALFSKGEWGPSSSNPDDISPADWQTAGRGPWTLPGETHAWEGFPAAFPVEIPRRLLHYLSRVGDHVLDPFSGSGTTAVAALKTGRRFTGFDLDPEAINSTQRRLATVSILKVP